MPIPYTVPSDFLGADYALARAMGATAAQSNGSGAVPLISWDIPQWYIDPQNGSDTNSGEAIGDAFKTWAHLLVVWGSQRPILDVDVTVTYLSAPNSPTEDPIVFEGGGAGSLTVVGSLNLPVTANFPLPTVTARNRTVGAPAILACASPWGGCQVGQLVINGTHPSAAVVYKNVDASSPVEFCQPQTYTPPPAFGAVTEVNTWATGDLVTVFNLLKVHVLRFSFSPTTLTSKGGSLYRLDLGPVPATISIGEFTRLIECTTLSELAVTPAVFGPLFLNCRIATFSGGIVGGSSQTSNFFGGAVVSMTASNVGLFNDMILGDNQHILNGAHIGDCCIDATVGKGINMTGPCEHRQGSLAAPPVIWGSGKFYLVNTFAQHTAPATTAYACALGIGSNTDAFAQSVSGGVLSFLGSGTAGRAMTPANLDLDVGSGGFGGFAWRPEGFFSSIGI